ncbi:hypothetical protein T492DRAFT_919440 [Pavlovales sp. CCMP2436]|nr:hypothetical protein T492DRAFT_919440 [Pavlovales sp. CCMP2436]
MKTILIGIRAVLVGIGVGALRTHHITHQNSGILLYSNIGISLDSKNFKIPALCGRFGVATAPEPAFFVVVVGGGGGSGGGGGRGGEWRLRGRRRGWMVEDC